MQAKRVLALDEEHSQGGAEAVREAGLQDAAEQVRALIEGGAPGVHLYTLKQAKMTVEIHNLVKDLF